MRDIDLFFKEVGNQAFKKVKMYEAFKILSDYCKIFIQNCQFTLDKC